jgi:hypothetical protein
MRRGSSLTIGTSVSKFRLGWDSKVVFVEEDGRIPKINFGKFSSSGFGNVKPGKIELRLSENSNANLYSADLVTGTGMNEELCQEWKNLLVIRKSGNSKDPEIECSGGVLRVRRVTASHSEIKEREAETEEKYWTDGRIAGVAVGSGLGFAAIVAVILVIHHFATQKTKSKNKSKRRIHPRPAHQDDEDDQDEHGHEHENSVADSKDSHSAREDLLDEAPLEPDENENENDRN